MKSLRYILLSMALVLTPQIFADDPAKVYATVDRNQVGVGDVIHLTVSISSPDSVQVDEPALPPLSGFELINTSSATETRSTFANGRFMTTQARNFIYMIAITQKGVLEIPAIPVRIDGKTIKTAPIKISATNARSAPQAQRRQQQPDQEPQDEMDQMEEMFNQMLQRHFAAPGMRGRPGGGGQAAPQESDPSVNPNEAFFVKAETDKTKAYVGEQITANFYLYTRGQIRDIDTLKYPDLKGFWKEELEMATRLNMEQAVVNGIPYQRALLVSYALFPIKAGKSNVDSYKAKCTVLTPTSFGFGQPYVFTKASKPIPIEVSDIPTTGRPENFSGAVGRFKVSAQFEPPTGTVNQPVTLRVRFEGLGNAKLIELPKLELPPSFELYDQKNQAKFAKDGTSYKEFEVMIIPRQPGVFKIPAIATSVFAPDTAKFINITTQPLDLTVTGTATTPAAPTLPGQAAVENKPAPPAEPSLPTLSSTADEPLISNKTWLALSLASYVLVLAGLGMFAWKSLKRRPKRANLKIVLGRRMKTVRELAAANEWRRVGVQLTNTLYYVLGQISEQGGANLELHRMLEHTPPSLRAELAEPLQKLASQTELLSFAPENMLGSAKDQAQLNSLIKEFETVMNRAIELAEI